MAKAVMGRGFGQADRARQVIVAVLVGVGVGFQLKFWVGKSPRSKAATAAARSALVSFI